MTLKLLKAVASILVSTCALSSELGPDLGKLPTVGRVEMLSTVPEVNEAVLMEVFGHDLSILPLPLENFLLAVSLDKVTPKSLTFFEPIGIPFIVEKGDAYWIYKYVNGDRELSTLLNLAILFSVTHKPYFADNSALDLDTMQHNLLLELENKGYWPATYLLAEQSLLSASADENIIQTYQQRMISCAEINFIPCQLRIGIAMANSQKYQSAVAILSRAISVYFYDDRYSMQDLAAVVMTLGIMTSKKVEPFLTKEQTNAYQKQLIALTSIPID